MSKEQIIERFLSSIEHLFEESNHGSKRPQTDERLQKTNKTLPENKHQQGFQSIRFSMDVDTNSLKIIF